ncbi:magnesium transporter MgtC [Paenibacillus selenitireducens]|uniref:Magnesium transporter MgtC n=1 Tax=Paenibacillus selenitireducens TaxID=1324314 RepID=A0A1T2X3R8_9BACL|nr:MgtC/SapB family protein [Paenibacillus selenitireducens]OPA74346.1 magnesium transporter MgtC [Paenibacillus selenitireducens]
MKDPWVIDNLHVTIRLLLAMLLGGLVGFEREHNNHAAGLRTHILVCVGSTLIMLLSIYGFAQFVTLNRDPARLAASVITGIGFLGAGTILFTGKSITGLTTAASLWVVAAIGLAIGAGFYYAAVAATLLVLLNLWVLNKIEQKFLNGKKARILTIRAVGKHNLIDEVAAKLTTKSIMTKRMTLTETRLPTEENIDVQMELQLHVVAPKQIDPINLIVELKSIDGVFAVSVE